MAKQTVPPLPLPKNWTQKVRSAAVHAIALARLALTTALGQANSADPGSVRIARLTDEFLLIKEEMRIKDGRMAGIHAQRRPDYLPFERLAILQLRAARGWSQSQTAERMLITPATVAAWTGRLDEEGPTALVQMREPVNRFPDFVVYLVRRLKTRAPPWGRCASPSSWPGQDSTWARPQWRGCWRLPPGQGQPSLTCTIEQSVRLAPTRSGMWILSFVPTAAGFWVPWLPWALPQRWPFCWWVGIIVDHFSRRIMGVAVFTQNPTSVAVRQMLGRAIRNAGCAPSHLITDQGTQFTDEGFRRWCKRRGIRQRFGAVQKCVSISVIERLMRTMKSEALRRILVPLDRRAFRREVGLFVEWYNGHRPHSTLQAATPDEIYSERRPGSRAPRFEPRRGWPRGSPCAGPPAWVRGRCGQRIALDVTHLADRRHPPIIELKLAA
ncbi:MAG: transposase [Acidobacteria bacterium]|nr:MAG: transposase [Acidobacteriota bacterium]